MTPPNRGGMEDVVKRIAAIKMRASTDLAGACDQARDLVAANPDDAEAAALLQDVVQSSAKQASPLEDPTAHWAPAVAEASRLLDAGQDEAAEIKLRAHLRQLPSDTMAMMLMANIASRCELHDDAERILRRAIQRNGSSPDLWLELGRTLHRRMAAVGQIEDADVALESVDQALKLNSSHHQALAFKSGVQLQLRRLPDAHATSTTLVAAHPFNAPAWVGHAFLLKTMGRFGESVAAYRTAAALQPANSAAWLGLANLKLAQFFPADVPIMEDALRNGVIDDKARVELHMALAKAFDAPGQYGQAIEHLEQAGALRNKMHPHDADTVTREVSRAIDTFTPNFLSSRARWGLPARDPIFILGMPRSGSTLVEQILASHSAIEGTEELFIVQQLVTELTRGKDPDSEKLLNALDERQVAALGKRYLDLARTHRKTHRPRFTDKTPASWRHVGLIHSILPNASIIDIRRNPMDCCFANYAQHFQWGVNFSYSQTDVARYYSDYARLMRHFDAVLPGRIHRIIYEDLVDNLEGEVRRLFDYLELPFEPSCLRFFETERAVHTPSSEQVRQPINRSGIDRWKNYEPWLGELKAELGDLATDWRD